MLAPSWNLPGLRTLTQLGDVLVDCGYRAMAARAQDHDTRIDDALNIIHGFSRSRSSTPAMIFQSSSLLQSLEKEHLRLTRKIRTYAPMRTGPAPRLISCVQIWFDSEEDFLLFATEMSSGQNFNKIDAYIAKL